MTHKSSAEIADPTTSAHGFRGFREALADRDLVRMVAVSGNTIQGDLQTPAYTRAIMAAYAISEIELSPAIDPDAEPTARQSTGNTVRGNNMAEKVYLIPRNALRMVVGSLAVTAENVKHVRDELVRVQAEGSPTTIALYESYDHAKFFDPITASAREGYRITDSSKHGRHVWVADSAVLAPQGSFPDIRYPEMAQKLLERDDTVVGPDAMAEANNALDYLNDRMLNG